MQYLLTEKEHELLTKQKEYEHKRTHEQEVIRILKKIVLKQNPCYQDKKEYGHCDTCPLNGVKENKKIEKLLCDKYKSYSK